MLRILKWLGIALVLGIAAAVFAYWTPDTDPAAMRTKYGAPPSRFVDLGGGLVVHVRDEGPRTAPVIVLLHGANSSLQTWDSWTVRLVPAWRVIRFDQIGHGLTGPNPSRDYSDNAFADTVDRLTTKLGVGKFVLAGSSMGGRVAWEYARRHPGRLRGLVLLDAPGAGTTAGPAPGAPNYAQWPVIRDALLHITPRPLVASALQGAVSNKSVMTDAAIDRYWELLRYPGNRQASIDMSGVPRKPTTPNTVACIAIPTLILWGKEDEFIPVTDAYWFRRAIPNSTLIAYPGVGHLPMEEIPDRTIADLTAWLAKLPGSR